MNVERINRMNILAAKKHQKRIREYAWFLRSLRSFVANSIKNKEDKMKIKSIMGPLAGIVLLAGCSKQEQVSQAPAVEIPPVFVAVPIEGTPVPIPEARAKYSSGDEVLLTGLIMGVLHPFVEGRGVFVLGDESTITPCDRISDDHCKTPWDACCDPSEILSAGTVTIQVLGDDGKPLRTGIKGVNGLSELSRVTVAGIVADSSSPEAFVVNASAIYIGER